MELAPAIATDDLVLHRRFRCIVTLLTLVTAINYGQPRFPVDKKTCSGAFEESLQPRDRSLNAITTLLVRNYEVIATAVNSAYKVLASQMRMASVEKNCDTDDESDHEETESSESATLQAEAPAPRVIAITNPQDKDNYSFGDNPCLLVEKGTSHIVERFGDWDQLLAIPEDDPFPNHVATLEDFLHKFSEGRSKLLAANFSKYIVARCWEKMHRRITHWFSRVTVRAFFLLKVEGFVDRFSDCKFNFSTRQDSMLAGLLMKKQHDENVLDILKRLCPDNVALPDLGKLVAAFESTRASPETSANRTPGTGWYTKATCREFHKLFVSSLIAYGNSLRILSRAHSELNALQKVDRTVKGQRAIKGLTEKLPKFAEQVWKCVYLVWRIADSRILLHHFKLLRTCNYLPCPSKTQTVAESKVFGKVTKEWKVEAVDELEDGKAYDRPEAMANEDEESEEFNSMLDVKHLDESFMRWMQLQVAYSVGQDILTSKSVLSASILPKLDISIVTARYPSGVDREMEPWDALLRSHHFDFPQGFDVETAIEAIKTQVTSRINQSSHPIFQKFQLPDFLPIFPGNLHCEMILAILLKLSKLRKLAELAELAESVEVAQPNALERLAQDLDDCIISVSKLCCPVCWDTLIYLRTGREFAVRGCHPVLSPVQLPYSLPFKTLENMTIRYKLLLRAEVINMMNPDESLESLEAWNDLQSNAGMSIDGSEETTSSMSSSWPPHNFPPRDPSPPSH